MDATNFPSYYKGYIEKVPDGEPLELLEIGVKETIKVLAMVTEDQAEKPYEEGKWTIKDILQHMIDTERIFSYRALSIAREEEGKLIGYNHEVYASKASANNRSLKELLEELKELRSSTITLFRSFNTKMLNQQGNANGLEIKVDQLMHILIGHELHHLSVIEKHYLS